MKKKCRLWRERACTNERTTSSSIVYKTKSQVHRPIKKQNMTILSGHEIKKEDMENKRLQNITKNKGNKKISFNHIFGLKY